MYSIYIHVSTFTLCSSYCVFCLQVLVTKNVNGRQKQIRRMGKGEHFGEQALIR